MGRSPRPAARIAVAMAALALASLVGCADRVTPSPRPDLSPTQPASLALASSPTTSPSAIPWDSELFRGCRLPGTTASPAGKYCWEGAPSVPGRQRDPSGMHRVIGDGDDEREVVAMLFAVGPDCLKASRESRYPCESLASTALSSSPSSQRSHSAGTKTTTRREPTPSPSATGPYASTSPGTHGRRPTSWTRPRRSLNLLQATPIGSDRVRTLFTLDAGWDTG